MRSRLLFAIPLASILGGLMVLHAYWALGGRWGSAHTVPTINGRRSFDPSPLATWAVFGLLEPWPENPVRGAEELLRFSRIQQLLQAPE